MLKTLAMTVAVAAISLSALPVTGAAADPMMHMAMHDRMMMKRHHMMERRHMMMRHHAMMHRDM